MIGFVSLLVMKEHKFSSVCFVSGFAEVHKYDQGHRDKYGRRD
jgi:hypothetical protein